MKRSRASLPSIRRSKSALAGPGRSSLAWGVEAPHAVRAPFRQFVLKVHSRCDLACDHCYVYEHADASWRGRLMAIASATVAKAGERIAEHAREHALAEARVILHGGEPLLAGAARLGEIAASVLLAITPVCALALRIHTNGV